MSETRVLVVDDSDTTRTLIARTLERAGFAVTVASDGAEGAAAALRELPAVVVTDLDMPVMDGHQLLRLLKSEPATAGTPVVVLTSHGEARSRFWGRETGADAYLTKDGEPDQLAATVTRLAATVRTPERADPAPTLGTLDVLTRVVRQLDTRLLHVTLVNTLLEKGLRAGDVGAACAVTFEVARNVADVQLLAVGVTEPDAAALHVQIDHPVSLDASRVFNDAVMAAMNVPHGVTTAVRVTGTPEGDGDVDTSAMAVFPLPLRDAEGVLALLPSEPQRFAAASRPLLQELTPHIALVLDNARLAQRLQQLSTHDGLTRLLNHRAIHERLASENERAARYGRPLTVILCDLDHFKLVNDTHGHLAGDAVLRAAAWAMARNLRECDAIGRYGGEEFMAVLPEDGLEAGVRVAERLRQALAERPVTLPSGATVPVTGSFGVASRAELPVGATADALMRLADSRLYEAKAAGRDCVRP
ncbi:MAG TPA: diguanylate cyclase [Thermoanaerobaculaceae bacterium]|nr:diguanylate cyclase [Thermoanaerobaculaceae bacterium]